VLVLTTTTVGTLEFRNICEPIINLKRSKGDSFTFHHAEAIRINTDTQEVVCRSAYAVAANDDENAPRSFPEFNVGFDKLVIATGSQAATFGIPGVTGTLP
jgi:NADH dehydrogenase FAD-containing subunit